MEEKNIIKLTKNEMKSIKGGRVNETVTNLSVNDEDNTNP